MRTRKLVLMLVAIMLVGLVIVALPDSGSRLFSLSKQHGPSTSDLLGLTLVLIPYGILVAWAWGNRQNLRPYRSRSVFIACYLVFLAGMTWVVVAMIRDSSYGWIPGAVLMAAAQLPVFHAALRR